MKETTPEHGAEPIRPDRLRRLARLRDVLEIGWEAGVRPRAEDLLDGEPEVEHPYLLRKLLEIELVLRIGRQEQPAIEEYLARLPADAALVRDVFGLFSRRGDDEPPPGSDPTSQEEACLPPRLGRYRVVSLLGEGGFGAVYLAYDDDLLRPVAIKVPHPRRLSHPGAVEGYLNEARALASLEHPNIIPVFDVGRAPDGAPYVVSKLVEGCTLTARLRDGRPGFAESAALAAALAEALHYSHLKGFVHRDVKPANILLDAAGKPYLADFGLALRDEEFGTGPRGAGTPAYMSPEQARGEGHRVDGRSDVFSLGVVLYEMLTGRRPFRSDSATELLDQIVHIDPRPPRQVDDAIPRELERICVKALAKPASQRYLTARDMAEDLRLYLATGGAPAAPPPSAAPLTNGAAPSGPVTPSLPTPQPVVVPKGLRPFDASDIDFFLDLLPGPRDRDGLPEALRFWKGRVEQRDPDQTFPVGLIYGPSGCGKSSLVRAGLLPRLAGHVTAVYVECTGGGTEARLLKRLRKQRPRLPEKHGLAAAVAALRRGAEPGRKVLIVLDQFEQWLHARPAEGARELVEALRQCDGGHVQCLLLVRDDFWMAATRFLRELEVPLVEGDNAAAVDLFDAQHAKKVLTLFGRAFGAVPERDAEQTDALRAFLNQAVAGLSEGGLVIPVRLAVFAEMVKGLPWCPPTLRTLGGMEGIGGNFLEKVFSAPTAPSRHRLHQKAVRATLKALLPGGTAEIKGNRRSRQELLEASGYAGRPNDFDDLLRLLERDLRLISPSGAEGADSESGQGTPGPSYQLTHDYLVPSVREWLDRKRKETRRGRAELRLEERAALWAGRPEARNLPSWWEWANIRLLTRRRDWAAPQAAMMGKADRYYLTRGLLAAAAALLVGWGAVEYHGSLTAQRLLDRVQDTAVAEMPDDVAAGPFRAWVNPLLHEAYAKAAAERDPKKQLRLALALLPSDPDKTEYVYGRLFDVEPAEFAVLVRALLPRRGRVEGRLWAELEDRATAPDRRFRAACALAAYGPNDPRWGGVAEEIASRLAGQNSLVLVHWKNALQPARDRLLPHLGKLLHDASRPDEQCRTIAGLFREYAGDRPEVFAPLERQMIAAGMREPGKEWKPGQALGLANLGASLISMGRGEVVWPLLQHSPDPTVRTYLVNRLGKLADPDQVLTALKQTTGDAEPVISTRRAMVLALGGFGYDRLSPSEQRQVVPLVARLFREDPDPGVHSAVEWLLRRWGHAATLAQAREGLASGQRIGRRRWYLSREGLTFAILPSETTHWIVTGGTHGWQSLGRDLAFATKEVTVEEFRRFLADHKHDPTIAPTQDCPVNMVSYYRAAEFCNWLSKQDKIPKEQWCYEPTGDGRYADGMKIRANFLDLTGYRLPTESEWQAAARAGAVTKLGCGQVGNDLLVEYACYHQNSFVGGTQLTFPAGRLKPNDFGLFDLHGNVHEWSHDDSSSFYARSNRPSPFKGRNPNVVNNNVTRLSLGGSFYDRSYNVTCDVIVPTPPHSQGKNIGLRPVRTFR